MKNTPQPAPVPPAMPGPAGRELDALRQHAVSDAAKTVPPAAPAFDVAHTARAVAEATKELRSHIDEDCALMLEGTRQLTDLCAKVARVEALASDMEKNRLTTGPAASLRRALAGKTT